MGRVSGRSAAETRAIILQSATELILERGASVSLDDVAERAGLSKGGVLYHFPNKNELMRGLTQRHVQAFRDAVAAHTDPADAFPGRLTRAYVRASVTGTLGDATSVRDRFTLMTLLARIPSAAEIWETDSTWWEGALAADGLDTVTQDLVIAAADGAAMALMWDAYPEERATHLEQRLIDLTREIVDRKH